VENSIAGTTLEAVNVMARVERLNKVEDDLEEQIAKINRVITNSEGEISKRNAMIERKQNLIDQYNKRLESMINAAGVSMTVLFLDRMSIASLLMTLARLFLLSIVRILLSSFVM
jgi:predicted  nucleic acid-binding Zn-ribbon protein